MESPLIFNLFINVLLDYLEDANLGVSLAPNTKSCTAGFADDLATVVAAPTMEQADKDQKEIQQRLEAFSRWANLWINVKKSS